MEQNFRLPVFQRALLTAVFVGIMITLATMFYDVIFIESTGLPFTQFINVSTLIFAVNLLFLAIGPIYYWFTRLSKAGEIIFMVLFALLTIFLVIKIKGVDRTNDPALNIQFRHLLTPIVIIVGAGACFLLPLLFHNRKFEKNVL